MDCEQLSIGVNPEESLEPWNYEILQIAPLHGMEGDYSKFIAQSHKVRILICFVLRA